MFKGPKTRSCASWSSSQQLWRCLTIVAPSQWWHHVYIYIKEPLESWACWKNIRSLSPKLFFSKHCFCITSVVEIFERFASMSQIRSQKAPKNRPNMSTPGRLNPLREWALAQSGRKRTASESKEATVFCQGWDESFSGQAWVEIHFDENKDWNHHFVGFRMM